MKSLFPLIGTSLVLGAASAHAGDKLALPSPAANPTPGNSHKTTRVDFDHDNNGWGNGDQDAPGNSGGNNNAENGPGNTPPPGNPGGNNGWGNGDQTAPGNSAANNNAENGPKSPTPNTAVTSSTATTASKAAATTSSNAANTATTIVARRLK